MPTVKRTYASQDGSVRYLSAYRIPERMQKENQHQASVEAASCQHRPPNHLRLHASRLRGRLSLLLTAQLGLIRNLTPAEILAQILLPLEQHNPTRAAN